VRTGRTRERKRMRRATWKCRPKARAESDARLGLADACWGCEVTAGGSTAAGAASVEGGLVAPPRVCQTNWSMGRRVDRWAEEMGEWQMVHGAPSTPSSSPRPRALVLSRATPRLRASRTRRPSHAVSSDPHRRTNTRMAERRPPGRGPSCIHRAGRRPMPDLRLPAYSGVAFLCTRRLHPRGTSENVTA
jgi:hypothetical protein